MAYNSPTDPEEGKKAKDKIKSEKLEKGEEYQKENSLREGQQNRYTSHENEIKHRSHSIQMMLDNLVCRMDFHFR